MKEIGLADYVHAMLMTPALEAGAIPIPKATVLTEPLTKPTSAQQPRRRHKYSPLTRVRGFMFPKKNIVHLTKPKGIVIGTPTISTPLIPEEDEQPILGGANIIPPFINEPVKGLDEEEHVAITIKASMDTT